ncbi:MAG: hypothetical protein OXT72_00590 [Gammaproteobacteria bacterium]|nr:hypothetical protein [Gammaproteobacteria bacterium]MDE0246687.1 hypothetical protein [Gammaproteobacteria bacterium]
MKTLPSSATRRAHPHDFAITVSYNGNRVAVSDGRTSRSRPGSTPFWAFCDSPSTGIKSKGAVVMSPVDKTEAITISVTEADTDAVKYRLRGPGGEGRSVTLAPICDAGSGGPKATWSGG